MNLDTDPDVRRALHDIVSGQPFAPDPLVIGRRARRARRQARITRGGAGVGLAAVVATAVTVAGNGPAHPARPTATAAAPTNPATPTTRDERPIAGPNPLAQLSYVLLAAHTPPAGDATLEIKHSTAGGQSATTYQLFADDGRYYLATSAAGLAAEVQGHNADGPAGQEIDQSQRQLPEFVAAAKKAATGGLAAARNDLLDVGQPAGWTPPSPDDAQRAAGEQAGGQTENYIWENARVALVTDPGDPQVRAGVFRVVATLPDVKVTDTTTAGQPTLTIEASGDAVGGGYEQIVVSAASGVPISEAEGDSATTITAHGSYEVSRVTLAAVAGGRL